MAEYTNYSIVSWSDTTPITSVRLNQMSTNIDQVKIVSSDKPNGIIRIRTGVGDVSNGVGEIFSNTKIIALTQETSGNTAYDNRVTLDSSRYYRLTFVCPGIMQLDAGGEDSTYYIKFRTGNTANTGSIVSQFVLSSGIGAFYSVAAKPTTDLTYDQVDSLGIRPEIIFGAGTYSYVFQGDSQVVNGSYFVELQRTVGPSGNVTNSTGWTVLGSSGQMQFYIEDIGGIA
jgi:hypothetical protein